ncbi:MAG TPA: NrfD/PsrC family molybdoenzyme membrane anchor subunit [Noviherbaspirillum sp.]
MQTKSLVNTAMMIGLAGIVVGLGIALANLISDGHAAFNTSSEGVIWGLPVVNYVFFALCATGLSMIASLAMVFGFKQFYPIAKRCIWMSLAALVAGFVSLAMELGNPFRLLWAVPLNFQSTSPLNWMGLFYGVFLLFAIAKFRLINAGDWKSDASKKLGVVALVAELAAGATLGAAFGMMAMRPMWYDPQLPVYFLVTAGLSGAALAVLTTYLAYGSQAQMPEKVRSLMQGSMPKAFAAALGASMIALAARVIGGLWSNADGLQVWDAIVGSPWFWLEVILMVVSYVLLVGHGTRHNGNVHVAASLMVILAVFIGRYEFVIGGQMAPMFKGAWVQGLISYTPSLTEWMMTLASVSIVLAGWAIGEKMFNLSAAPEDAS